MIIRIGWLKIYFEKTEIIRLIIHFIDKNICYRVIRGNFMKYFDKSIDFNEITIIDVEFNYLFEKQTL